MAKFRRNPWPKKIVWVPDNVIHDQFSRLKIPDKAATSEGLKITAIVDGQVIFSREVFHRVLLTMGIFLKSPVGGRAKRGLRFRDLSPAQALSAGM